MHFCTVGIVVPGLNPQISAPYFVSLSFFKVARQNPECKVYVQGKLSLPPTPTSQIVSPWPSSILAFSCLWRISNSSALGLTNCNWEGRTAGEKKRGREGAEWKKDSTHHLTEHIVWGLINYTNPLTSTIVVSCPAPPHTWEKEGLVFWATFLVTWGGVAPWSERSNQIAECIIICAWCKQSYFEPNY